MTTRHSLKERLQTYFKKKDIRRFPYDRHYFEAESIELLITDDNLLPKILHLIESAQFSIIIHVYILEEDTVGNTIIYALARQAQRGVSVTLMTDAVGTNMFSPDRITLCR